MKSFVLRVTIGAQSESANRNATPITKPNTIPRALPPRARRGAGR